MSIPVDSSVLLVDDAVDLGRAARSEAEATAAEDEEEGRVKLSLKGSSEGEEEEGRVDVEREDTERGGREEE